MKFLWISILIPFSCLAQPYDTVRIGYTTSVNMIFSSPVKKWDMGLGIRIENGQEIRDVLVENPVGSPERIKLAAGIENFETTNLFVETEKAYYNFILTYDKSPRDLLIKININKASIIKREVKEADQKKETVEKQTAGDTLENYIQKIHKLDNELTNIGQASQKMLFYLGGIYVRGDHLFFKIYIKNGGNIKYDIGFVGFFRGDKGKRGNKKRPIQNELLTPVFISNKDKKVIESGKIIVKVYAFKKFTLSKNQKLYIQFWEAGQGERKVELIVRGKDILAAKML